MEGSNDKKMNQPRYRPGTKFVFATDGGENLYVLDEKHFVSMERVFDLEVIDKRNREKMEPIVRQLKKNV